MMMIERLIHERMITFLDKKLNVLCDYQFGFRQKCGTENAPIEMTDMVTKAIDSGKIASGVFIDLQKAFDLVDHEALLEVLEKKTGSEE